MKNLRAAVIGVGHLGRFHAQKYAAIEGVELVGVADADPGRAAAVAAELAVACVSDYRMLLGQIDLVSVAVPTERHFEVVQDCLAAGVHVLVEKPITQTVAQADALIQLAERQQRLLQVGHLERFNPAWLALRARIQKPIFIEAHRLAPFKPRGTDVSVVLDLMIHDLDLILSVINSPVRELRASGVPVLTDGIDIGNARIEFDNGCVANLSASRVSTSTLRKMRLFQKDEYLSIDFGTRQLSAVRRHPDPQQPLASEAIEVPPGDALHSEISAFVAAVRQQTAAVVDGVAGRRALALALELGRQMQQPQQRTKDLPA